MKTTVIVTATTTVAGQADGHDLPEAQANAEQDDSPAKQDLGRACGSGTERRGAGAS